VDFPAARVSVFTGAARLFQRENVRVEPLRVENASSKDPSHNHLVWKAHGFYQHWPHLKKGITEGEQNSPVGASFIWYAWRRFTSQPISLFVISSG
jgi:hypothetical protein